jgi:hypothetical protein
VIDLDLLIVNYVMIYPKFRGLGVAPRCLGLPNIVVWPYRGVQIASNHFGWFAPCVIHEFHKGGFSVCGFPQPSPSARCSLLLNLRSIVVKLSPI